jgi:hypothetical protein
MWASYGDPYGSIKCSGDAYAHLILPRWSPEWITDGDDLNFADSEDDRQKGNDGNKITEASPPRLLPLRRSPSRGAPPRPLLAARGARKWWRWRSPELGFRRWFTVVERERDRGWTGDPRAYPRWHGPFYRLRRAVACILAWPSLPDSTASCFGDRRKKMTSTGRVVESVPGQWLGWCWASARWAAAR